MTGPMRLKRGGALPSGFGDGTHLPQRAAGLPGPNLPKGPAPERPTSGPATDVIYDPHHYGKMIPGSIALAGVQAPAVKFLPAPSGKRNLLILRNFATVAGGNADILIGFGQEPGPNAAVRIVSGQTWGFDETVPQDDLWVQIDTNGNGLAQALVWSYSVIQPPSGL